MQKDQLRAVPAFAPDRHRPETGRDASDVVLQAAAYGIDLDRWDSDWLGACLYLAGIGHERCASLGPIEGLA